MRPTLMVLACVVSAAAGAQEQSDTPEERRDRERQEAADRAASAGRGERGPLGAGRMVFRGGLSFTLNDAINLGGGAAQPAVYAGLNLGIGYFVVDNLSLDLDGDADFRVSPDPALAGAGVLPGLRFHPFRRFYVRGGAPIHFLPTFGYGVLAGVGYLQPLGGSASLVLGVDYTYYLTPAYRQAAPQGKLDVHAGVQAHF